jgi:Tfp pilus assembly protein PilX
MRRRLAQENGIALVMALGLLIVLSISTMAMLTYTTDNARSVRYQGARVSAYTLAEAGVNEAVSVLNLPANNAIEPCLLLDPAPPCNKTPRTSPYAGGTARWSGTFSKPAATWTITSTGTVSNPSGAAPVTKTLTVNVQVTPSLSQQANNQAWNYIYSKKPNDGNPDVCEMTITQSVKVSTPLFVEGDLCINNGAGVLQGPHGTTLVVKGRLHMANAQQDYIGATKQGNNTIVNRISEAYIGNGCILQNNPVHASPCSDTDNVYATKYDTVQPNLGDAPVADFNAWYNGSAPGPKFPCVPEHSSAPSTWPAFEMGDTVRSNSVTPAVNLTPLTAYDCWTAAGELAWNPTTRVLTVNGTVYIDGSAYIQNDVKPAVYTYSGMGTLYLSGTFLLKNAILCAVLNSGGTACDTANWNPNVKALIIATDHWGDNGLPNFDGIQLVSGYFQGGVYATYDVDIDTSSSIDGPIVGNVVSLGQSVNTSFPFVSFVPNGAPGGQIVYAQPLPPTGYDG